MVSRKKKSIKEKKEKSFAHRELEIESLVNKLLDFGLPIEDQGVQEFIRVAKEFQDNGISMTGKINLYGFQRVINYVFSMQPHIESRVTLEYNKFI
jgi:hypothetical protein